MQLPFLHKKSENDAENYFGLFLQEDKVTGFVYELLKTKIHILAQHSSNYTNGMENIVEDIDDLLFRLETDTNKKLSKTIFYVTSHFLDEDSKQIKKEYKTVIKNITHELELHAMGFIECYEAVAALIVKKEGVHLNLVLIELDQSTGHIFIYKNDKQIHSSVFERSEHLINDLSKKFNEIKGTFILPSRIILYPHSQSHKQLVNLVNHTWDEETFMQMPKVEAITEDELFTGLAEIFYMQLKDDNSSTDSIESVVVLPETEESSELKSETDLEAESEQVLEPEPKTDSELETESVNHPKKVMGFAIGEDMTGELANPLLYESALSEEHENEKESPGPSTNISSTSKVTKPFIITGFISSLRSRIMTFKPSLKLPFLIPLGVVILILILMLGSEFFLHKEVVHVTFPSKNIEKAITFTGDDMDIKSGSISASVSDSLSTSGKKDVGEKAKGEVTIRNFADTDKTVSKGSVLSVDGKNFNLDQDVKVASASVSSDNTTKVAGQAKGTVTADTIGPDYNLDKEKKFHIGDLDFSTYFAINENAFSGGSKKQIQTVSQKDITDLKTKVLNTGKKQGLDKMRAEVSKDQQIIDSLTDQELTNVDFSKEVGDESKTLSVKANVATNYYTYSDDTLKKKVQDSLKPDVEQGYLLPIENIQATVKEATKTKNKITLIVNAKGKSTKQISKDDLISAVKGKSKNDVDSIVKETFAASDITVEDKGLSFFPWMPLFKKNISVEVSSN